MFQESVMSNRDRTYLKFWVGLLHLVQQYSVIGCNLHHFKFQVKVARCDCFLVLTSLFLFIYVFEWQVTHLFD